MLYSSLIIQTLPQVVYYRPTTRIPRGHGGKANMRPAGGIDSEPSDYKSNFRTFETRDTRAYPDWYNWDAVSLESVEVECEQANRFNYYSLCMYVALIFC